jgi:hypothetical protein
MPCRIPLATVATLLFGMGSSGPVLADTAPDHGWRGVAASGSVDVAVVWNQHRIRLLRGSRYLLEGADDVAHVGVGPDGTVYAVRGESLFGVAEPGGEEHWHVPPVAGESRGIFFLGTWVGWVVWRTDVGLVLALTRDRGKTWTTQELPAVDEAQIRLASAGGDLDLLGRIYDCHSGDYSLRYRGHLGRGRWIKGRGFESEASSLGHDGTVYPFPTVKGRTSTYAFSYVDSRHLLRLDRGHKTLLDRESPKEMNLEAVDHLGRPLGILDGEVWMWSREKRWQRVE